MYPTPHRNKKQHLYGRLKSGGRDEGMGGGGGGGWMQEETGDGLGWCYQFLIINACL